MWALLAVALGLNATENLTVLEHSRATVQQFVPAEYRAAALATLDSQIEELHAKGKHDKAEDKGESPQFNYSTFIPEAYAKYAAMHADAKGKGGHGKEKGQHGPGGSFNFSKFIPPQFAKFIPANATAHAGGPKDASTAATVQDSAAESRAELAAAAEAQAASAQAAQARAQAAAADAARQADAAARQALEEEVGREKMQLAAEVAREQARLAADANTTDAIDLLRALPAQYRSRALAHFEALRQTKDRRSAAAEATVLAVEEQRPAAGGYTGYAGVAALGLVLGVVLGGRQPRVTPQPLLG